MLLQQMFAEAFLVAIVAVVCAAPVEGNAYKILVLPMPARSHVFPLFAMAESIADRGHEVTVLVHEEILLDVPEMTIEKRQNVHVLRYGNSDDGQNALCENTIASFLENQTSFKDQIPQILATNERWCRKLLTDNEPLWKQLEAANFDLVVVDSMFLVKCLYLIAHRLHLPVVTYTDFVNPLVARVPWLPSFVPSITTVGTDHMTFAERLTNFVSSFTEAVLSAVSDTPADVIDDYRLRYGYFRSFDELAARSLLWLFTRDHILDYPRPTMPHFINVGGLTIRRMIGNLPTDIASFVGEAPRGFLVVSFGSFASTLPEVIIRKLFDAFRRLDDDGYRFVVRLADAKGVDVPRNVMSLSWIPQNDLLAHGSVKGFVTHCGNCGQYEGVYHSVPMIGFPLFVDQHYNARRMQQKGYGITMNIHTFTSEELVNNVRSLANNQSYTDAVTKLSRLLRDSPESPAERAAFWIEHVCRHGGEHLRSSGQDLPVYAYVMIDVLMFVLLTAGCGVCCLWKTAQCSWRLLNKKTGRKQNLKEKIN